MIVAKSRIELEKAREQMKGKLALVPTMGALHEGHISLCHIALEKTPNVAASIFVNPTQFAPSEDLDSYPRTLEQDLEKLEKLGVTLVYVPKVDDIYPESSTSKIKAGANAESLESDFRPHFFDGVVNVVYRLFEQIKPDIAIFGEKDFQQLMVIREMVQNEKLPIDILAGETVRDDLGLALSSRNSYLSNDELDIARMLNQIMYGLAHGIAENIDQDKACDNARQMLLESGFDKIDYITYRAEWKRILVAAWLGKTRLIDNCAIPQDQEKSPPNGEPLLLSSN